MDIGKAAQDLVKALNDNSGFTMALVTIVYTLVTLAIVLGARRARLDSREAYVRVDAGLSLNAGWSWRDGCGRAHTESYLCEIARIAGDYRGSGVLIEHFPLDSLPEVKKDLDKIADALAMMAKAAAAPPTTGRAR